MRSIDGEQQRIRSDGLIASGRAPCRARRLRWSGRCGKARQAKVVLQAYLTLPMSVCRPPGRLFFTLTSLIIIPTQRGPKSDQVDSPDLASAKAHPISLSLHAACPHRTEPQPASPNIRPEARGCHGRRSFQHCRPISGLICCWAIPAR